jgi:hypothetical protein
MHFPRLSHPFCLLHDLIVADLCPILVFISNNFPFHCLEMSDEVQSEPERDLIRQFDVISAVTVRSMTPRRQLKRIQSSSMRTKDASECRCMLKLCENHERGNLLMLSMRFCGKQKKTPSVLDPLHHDFLSRFKSFAIFQFWAKFNEKSVRESSKNSINLRFFVSENSLCHRQNEKKRVEIDCSDEKSMEIKNSFVLFLNRENFHLYCFDSQRIFLSSSVECN